MSTEENTAAEEQEKGRAGKKHSFIRTIETALAVYFVLLAVLLAAIFGNARRTMQANAGQTLSQAAATEVWNLDRILEANENALAALLRGNADIPMLSSADATKRSVAAQNVLQSLQSVMTTNDIQYLLVYDRSQKIYLSNYTSSRDFTYADSEAIKSAVMGLADEGAESAVSRWTWSEVEGKGYAVRLYVNSSRIIGAYVPDSYIRKQIVPAGDLRSAFTDSSGRILWQTEGDGILTSGADTASGNLSPAGETDIVSGNPGLSGDNDTASGGQGPAAETVAETGSGSSAGEIGEAEAFPQNAAMDVPSWTEDHARYYVGTSSTKGRFRIFVSLSAGEVLGAWQIQQILVLLLILTAILFMAGAALYMRRVVARPLQEVLRSMGRIENGETDLRLPETVRASEIWQISEGFNRMMDTIVNLRMKSYEERIQFDEATLKYVQLQIRPHFFLNALTTIHSMTYQNRNEDIRTYIELLSKNIRYLFKGGLHTVPLSEEIAHAKDYIAMQDMLYPGNVFDFIEVEDSVAEYQVPQLIIHTMLENIYRHAVSADRLTSILISAKEEEHGGEQMCHISVEDDGQGYPPAFLEQIRQGNVQVRPDGHGVGLWNVRKTLSLMYRRDDLIEFGNKKPQGTRVDIWIPRRAKRQSSVWKL